MAGTADLGSAVGALGRPASISAVTADRLGPDPLATTFLRTTDEISGRELAKLLQPLVFEAGVYNFLDMLEGNQIGSAASRGHVL